MQVKMTTPIAYYGGKQQMLQHILPLVPQHQIYVEPFFGGGAVYWSKNPVKLEVINDTNMNVVNFYEVLKHDYFGLRKLIQVTLHSRETYKKALIIYDCPWLFADSPVHRAWAFYVVTNQGFSKKVGSWGYDKTCNLALRFKNKIDQFEECLTDRLRKTQIEQNQADKVISSRDTPNTFVYADPPYIDSHQGHYGGYTESHYRRDLDALATMKGKFLLSSYPSSILDEYIENHQWYTLSIDNPLSAKKATGKRDRKTEVLTANYAISKGHTVHRNCDLFSSE
ncbi:MAG: DNA adenine methylase [Flavobacteriales bacterium]